MALLEELSGCKLVSLSEWSQAYNEELCTCIIVCFYNVYSCMDLRSPPIVFSDSTISLRSSLSSRKEMWVPQWICCFCLEESLTRFINLHCPNCVGPQVKLVSIDAADVADGNPSIILGLIWNIILFFQVMWLSAMLFDQLLCCPIIMSPW